LASLELIQVSKTIGALSVLNHIDLTVEPGEFLVVVGPSGCGKSTLLRLIAGLDTVSTGRILMNGKCINTIAPAARDMAMVFQHYALYPHMSVYDNMAYALKMRKVSKIEIHKRVHEVAEILQLTPYLDRKPDMLSGGQKQRVAMGRAMVRSPAVFLFDEPLSHLDAQLAIEMRHEIKKMHRTYGMTCLYVTHSQIEAMTMASRVVVLNHGAIEQIGCPSTIYQYPASLFVAKFMGQHAMNMIPGCIRHHSIETVCRMPLPMRETLQYDEGDDIYVGIRPECFEISTTCIDSGVSIHIDWIDDFGEDRFLEGWSEDGHKFLIRLPYDLDVREGEAIHIKPVLERTHIFSKTTGLRLQGWFDENKA
jgi:sn-glycerol 3-phosphate transport system ATP-binding protein